MGTPRDRRMIDVGAYTWTADASFPFLGPKGKACRLFDYGVFGVTTTFAGATTTPHISVGISGSVAIYGADFDLGALTATIGAKSIRTTYRPTVAAFATYMLAAGQAIPADTSVYLKLVGATGGGAAGISHAFMVLDYDF